MSIASEITRLQTAKSELKTSINAKTDAQHQITTETLDDYSDFVDSIQTGGGKEDVTWHQCPGENKATTTYGYKGCRDYTYDIKYTAEDTLEWTIPYENVTATINDTDTAVITSTTPITGGTKITVTAVIEPIARSASDNQWLAIYKKAIITATNSTDTISLPIFAHYDGKNGDLPNQTATHRKYITALCTSSAEAVGYLPETVKTNLDTKPNGVTVDGVTYYNEEPNVETPFSSANTSGTLRPLDKLRWINSTNLPSNSPDYPYGPYTDQYFPATETIVIPEKKYYTYDGETYTRITTPTGNPAAQGYYYWINLNNYKYLLGGNCRDLGGWECDSGTVKYGVIVRSGDLNPVDKDIMLNEVGIEAELTLLPKYQRHIHYSPWDIEWYGNPNDADFQYNINVTNPYIKEQWIYYFKALFNTVNYNKPIIFHCGAGADKTGTLAVMIEAILGVSEGDIGKDYELTSFSTGIRANNIGESGQPGINRTKAFYSFERYINAIKNVPLLNSLSDSLRNRAISFLLSLGFRIEEINKFRRACIEVGEGQTLIDIPDNMPSYTVSKSEIANISYINESATPVKKYQEYDVDIVADTGYSIDSITVTMDGVDITDSCTEKEGDVYEIVSNGTYDIKDYNAVDVDVPQQGIIPVGTKTITTNGTHDVYNYESANVNVPLPKCKTFTFTNTTAKGNALITLISNDPDVAAHYNDPTSVAVLYRITQTGIAKGLHCVVTGNTAVNGATGIYGNYNGTSIGANYVNLTLDNNVTTAVKLTATSTGNILLQSKSSGNALYEGVYLIIFSWSEVS